ncbi:MAG: TlpA family protein disulfide reductase [Akkermansiaceae bacterium]|nr:TlpA family protein disulfide reductase [Akkermansiaceae bacterium]
MRFFRLILMLAATGALEAGSPRLAEQIRSEHHHAMQRWATQLRVAASPEEQLRVWEQRPDANEFGARMWTELRESLREEWILPYASWLLETAPHFASQKREAVSKRTVEEEIRRALDVVHFAKPGAGRLCLSLTALPNSRSLKVVTKVQEKNPVEVEQGQAAMARALLLRHLGDDPQVMRERLTHLRTAIIKAADAEVGDVTVAKLAGDELYAIKNLAKGRVAPDVAGRDVAGTALKLSDYRGKVVVLVFWSANMPDAARAVDILKKLRTNSADKEVALLGVTTDNEQVLRQLKANGTIPWRNFADADGTITKQFRVRNRPLVYVLDREGVIQFIGSPGSFVDLAVEALVAEKPGG